MTLADIEAVFKGVDVGLIDDYIAFLAEADVSAIINPRYSEFLSNVADIKRRGFLYHLMQMEVIVSDDQINSTLLARAQEAYFLLVGKGNLDDPWAKTLSQAYSRLITKVEKGEIRF